MKKDAFNTSVTSTVATTTAHDNNSGVNLNSNTMISQ